MSLLARGESNSRRITHPEGKTRGGKSLSVSDHWGDTATQHHALRLGFLNIQTFPKHVLHHKNGDIIQVINDNHLNCLGMAEVNLHWPMVSTQQQIQERTRGWFETTVSAAACNRHNTKVPNQQDGAAILARDQFAHRCFSREYDSLGRWMVLTFRGREGLALRVVSAYRPIPGSGPYTVYQQQRNYYSTIGNTKCPITNYGSDLTTLMQAWIDGGIK